MLLSRLPYKIMRLLTQIRRSPWHTTALVMLARFREDRLGLTAGSLTFTTITSLVPLATVALALFSVFPLFAQVEGDLQRWMVQSLFPAIIAQNVSTYLAQFTSKAAQLGWASLIFLIFTAVALMLTVDTTLNKIWRVKCKRSLSQRILVYWGGLTLGPLVLAASLSLSSYALTQSDLFQSLSTSLANFLQFCLITATATGMYRLVPNTLVRWTHALAGGLFVAVGVDLARRALSIYFAAIPGISTIYGAFATLPILLLWIYILWLIVLFGAVIAAYLPSILGGVARDSTQPSWPLQSALEIVQSLNDNKATSKGLSLELLARKLGASTLQIEPIVEMLQSLDWIALLDEDPDTNEDGPRWVLLIDPETTVAAPLLRLTVLPQADALHQLNSHISTLDLRLSDLIAAPKGENSA